MVTPFVGLDERAHRWPVLADGPEAEARAGAEVCPRDVYPFAFNQSNVAVTVDASATSCMGS